MRRRWGQSWGLLKDVGSRCQAQGRGVVNLIKSPELKFGANPSYIQGLTPHL